jgi:hypothetical protein
MKLPATILVVASVLSLTWIAPAGAETVNVKYRGPVDLAPFECHVITRSSFIRRVCYDASNEYMLIDLNGTFYHYCELTETRWETC